MEVEFVSYDGSFPNLCHGRLVLRIDGVETVFGSTACSFREDEQYPRFWCSGGCAYVDFGSETTDEVVVESPWEWCCSDEDLLPRAFLDHKADLLRVFNENVPEGCCGGCI